MQKDGGGQVPMYPHVTPMSLPSDGLLEADEVRTEILPSVSTNKRTYKGNVVAWSNSTGIP
jgi:hypothetical protein